MGGNITFTGLTGIDTETIIEQLMLVKRQPINLYQQEQQIIDTKRSIFSDISSKLSTLKSSADSLNSSGTLNGKKATSSDTSVLTVSANQFADVGDITISNVSLATKSSEAFTAIADQEAQFSSGTYFEFEVNGNTYTIDISTLSSEDQSLEGLRDAINEQAEDDVKAVIVNTGDNDDPYKLVLQSTGTGEDYQISNIDTDIVATTSSGDTALAAVVSDQVLAQDATFELNGLEVSRSSNTIDDLVEGLTITLKDESTDDVTISVTRNQEGIKEKLQSFVENYNAVNTVIQGQFEVNPETGFAGPLSGDFTLRQIQSSMQSIVVGGVQDSEGNRYSLGSLGIEIDKETGDLSFDPAAFDEAIAENPDLAVNILMDSGATSSSNMDFISASTDTTVGSYNVTVTGYDTDGNVEGFFTYDGVDYTGTGDGQVLRGPDGSPAADLKVRIDSGVTGDLGGMYYSRGIASNMESTLESFTSPVTGLLPKLDDQLQDDYNNLADQIDAFEERLDIEERILKQRFLAAEEAISQLQSQQSAFQSQLASLPS